MRVNRRQVARTTSLPAPVLGWDAQSPLAAMKPGNAVVLDNWTPRPGYVEIRRGFRQQTVGLTNPVESLLVYRGAGAGNDQIYAVSGGVVRDSGGSSAYSSIGSSNRVQYTNFANDGGDWILCCNGASTPFKYDGSSWTTNAITGSSGSITLDDTKLIDVMAHKNHIYWVEDDSLRLWVMPVNAISGAASLLDLGPVFSKGGTLTCQGSWSVDGGQGQDDLAVFMTDQGQVAIYQGSDPTLSTDWELIGVFDIGTPLGRRSLLRYGADLAFLTTTGVLLASQALRLNRAQEDAVALTQKVQNAFWQATRSYAANFGWEGCLYPAGGLAIYNIPTVTDSEAVQYVQNLQTGAWSRWTGMNAMCWAVANEKLYFGGTDGIYQADVGVTDNGSDLVADMVTAFSYFGGQGQQKQFTMLRPILNATSNVVPAVDMLVDFNLATPTATPTVISDRSTDLQIRYEWTGAAAIGYAGAVAMQVITQTDTTISADLVDGDGNTIVDADAGNTINTDSDEPITAQIQCVGFDVVFQPGGVL
jgi:hypothetical protein